MNKFLISDYIEEKTCVYKNECYSVRDNGAIYRHAKDNKKLRQYDNFWTFGNKNKHGYMCLVSHRVHIIVATAFYGEKDTKEGWVVDHIDTNRCNNRVENLRWVTRLENALSNPVTLKKIMHYYDGDIQKFLDNPSSIREIIGDNQDISWMRTVSSDEAYVAYKNVMQWASKPVNNYTNSNTKSKGMGEWIFQDYDNHKSIKLVGNYKQESKNVCNFEEIDDEDIITNSLTPNALQKNWTTPTTFHLCPELITNKPLEDYYNNLKKGLIISSNEHSQMVIKEYALYNNTIYVISENKDENAIKRYSLTTITFENNSFLHAGRLFFEYIGAEKRYTLLQEKEWTGGDSIDDYC